MDNLNKEIEREQEEREQEILEERRQQAYRHQVLFGALDMVALQKLVNEYLGARWVALLTGVPGSEESKMELAKSQGVNDFFIWLENRKRDIENYIGQ